MATNQSIVLEKISMEYHAFRKDQVLTHTQLNELIDFFEDQDRLTRTCLVGVGLVCGLGLTYDAVTSNISISKGCGVTTDGDLLAVNATTFKHFRAYENREKGTNDPIYDPFFPAPDGGKQIGLWELVLPNEKGELPNDSKELTKFKTATGKLLDDMVALLYVEYYLQDPDKCTAIDCDNQGPKQVAQIKVLLLTKSDMDKVINRNPSNEVIADSIYKKYYNAGAQFFNLPVLKARRVILNSSNTAAITTLAKSYTGIVQADGNKLISAVAALYSNYKFLIDPSSKTNIATLKQVLQQALSFNTKPYQAQYLYDYYKDIMTAYNELREMLFGCMSECCPDKYAFPKHIMLGELKPKGALPAPYRHEFYQSPAVTGCKDKVTQCRFLWARVQQMISHFHIPEQPSTVKITPSVDYDRLLGDRAIPFYYNSVKTIAKNWNFALSNRGADKTVLSYNADQYATGVDSTLNPLNYDIDDSNFFRIEGHLGKSLGEAMPMISRIKDEKSVPFDLVAVRLNKVARLSDINIDDFDCQFEDLNAILKAWLVEQNCLYGSVTRFFSGFSTNKTSGFHTRLDDYKAADSKMYMKTTSFMVQAEQPSVMVLEDSASALLCKNLYVADTTITDNLEVADSSLGVAFAETYKKGIFSADEVIADMKSRTASDPNLLHISEEEREVVYDVPINMVSYVSEISRLKPFTMSEINTTLLEKYMQRMEKLCAYVKKLRSRMENIFAGATYNRQGYESYYLMQIQQLIANCCAAEKLESLLDEIKRRKKKILEGLLFSNYAAQHPGLEHKAGVHRGGTFVLVYTPANNPTQSFRMLDDMVFVAGEDVRSGKKSIVANKARVIEEVTAVDSSIYEDIDSFAYHLVTNQGKTDFEKEVLKYEKALGIKHGSIQGQIFNKQLAAKIKEICAKLGQQDEAAVTDNIVIADFTLPYLCCSDCPPIAFIMPKQEFSLSLPKATACSDEAPLLFRKEPVSGVVKAEAGFEATVIEKDGETYFDPSKVPVALFGQEIRFTIDGQKTDCKITVVKHPAAKFEVKLDNENDETIQVIFTNKSDDDTDKLYTYEWDFGDGRAVETVTDRTPIVVVYYKSVLEKKGLNGKIPVVLKATNGSCPDEYTADVPYKLPQPASLLPQSAVMCNNASLLKFTATPASGIVAGVEEPTAVIKNGADYFFDPKHVTKFATPLSFTVNGKSTTCKITVYRVPTAKFTASAIIMPGATPNMMQVTFTNTSDPAKDQNLSYKWKFSDGTPDIETTNTDPFKLLFNIDDMRKKGLTVLTVMLFAKNPACEDNEVVNVQFPTQSNPTTGNLLSQVNNGLTTLNSNDLRTALNRVTTTAQGAVILSLYKDSVQVFTVAATKAGGMDSSAQLSILNMVQPQMNRLYTNKFSKSVNDVLVVPQVQELIKLALNMVKFTATPDKEVKKVLLAIVKDLIAAVPTLTVQMPKLNSGSIMNEFLDTYLVETNLAESESVDAIKKLSAKIKASFTP